MHNSELDLGPQEAYLPEAATSTALLLASGSIRVTLTINILDVRNGAFIGESSEWLASMINVKSRPLFGKFKMFNVCVLAKIFRRYFPHMCEQ